MDSNDKDKRTIRRNTSESAAQSGRKIQRGTQNGPDRISATPRRDSAAAQPAKTTKSAATKKPAAKRTTNKTAGQQSPENQNKQANPKKKRSVVARIFFGLCKFAGICICLGVMVGSVFAVLLSMYAVDLTANDAELLDLTNLKLAQTSKLIAVDPDTGEEVEYASFHDENNREWVSIQEIEQNEYLKWAFICVEDNTFYDNYGVNIKRTIGAAVNEVGGKFGINIYSSRQGASTITQQLIKNVLDDDETSIERKVREIFRAFGLNNRYDKSTILEAYLNTISLTGKNAGVMAGAQEYFGEDNLANLSAAECASIAAITKNPTQYNPYTNPEAHITRRNWILHLMNEQGKLSDAAYQDALNESLNLVEEKEQDVVTKSSKNSYFTDAVFTTLVQQLVDEKGYTEGEARNLIYNGGLRIYVTVDTTVQTALERLMLNTDDQTFPAYWREQEYTLTENTDLSKIENVVINEGGSYKLTEKTNNDGSVTTYYYCDVRIEAAAVVMNYEGQVLGLVGGLGEKTSDLVLNRALLDSGGQTPRAIGSTMKPIGAYALGIDTGLISYSTNLVDGPVGKILKDQYKNSYPNLKDKRLDVTDPVVLQNPDMFRDWPSNYITSTGHGERSVNINYAVAQSLNTVAMQVGMLVGTDYIYSFAKDTLGLNHLTEANVNESDMVLGTASVNMVELAGAYQMFGNGGEYVTPHLYTYVEYATTGEVVLDNTVNITHTQAIKPSTAMIMNKLLQGVLGSNGTAGASIYPAGEMAAAAKTGTTSDNKDYTFVGMTPYYVTSMWWGYDMPADMLKQGAKSAKPIQQAWKQLMETLQADLEFKAFPVSEDVVTAAFCNDTGDLANGACPSRTTGYYTHDNMPGTCTLHQ